MEEYWGSEDVVWHIPSKYSEEPAQKSDVVSRYIPKIELLLL